MSYGAMLDAGRPPAQATSIGVGGFMDDASAQDPADCPHPGL